MLKQKLILLCSLGILASLYVLQPNSAWAAEESVTTQSSDTEEIGYDELVRRLSVKANKPAPSADTSDFDKLKMYADFSWVTSYNSTSVNGSSDMSTANGFQLGGGIDLFSPNWIGKGIFRNFGQTYSGTRYRSEREFDLEAVFHENQFHVAAGLGTRELHINDAPAGVNIADSTPVSILAAGVDLPLSESIAMVLEMGWRSAIITTTSDKNSIDAVFGLSAKF